MKKAKTSLRMGLLATIVICWLVPIAIVVTLLSVLLGNSYRQSVRQEISAEAESAVERVQIWLQSAVDDSKQVSYDGVVRYAFREYLQDGHGITLYRAVNDYLNQRLAWDKKYQAIFINFWTDAVAQPYVLGGGATGRGAALAFREHSGEILEGMADTDTEIRFFLLDGELYMARNLLDSSFTAYATVVMMFDPAYMFGPLETLDAAGGVEVTVSGCSFRVGPGCTLMEIEESGDAFLSLEYAAPVDGCDFSVTVRTAEYNVWEIHPWLGWTVAVAVALVLPFLIVAIVLFSRHISGPMETLAQANVRVRSGERGYQIEDDPPNVDFERLYANFNDMSRELKNQFERSILEREAAQQAQIKALQYQISPHFLNNTLEIINWEARLAGNDRVGAMIEALSTMLDAALDRDNRSRISLRDELGYVDAYLYIIQERLGDSFHTYKEIDEDLLDRFIPRMILQPIVENAVEHDIAACHKGNLWVRAYCWEDRMVLEVEHDGTMTEDDRRSIDELLSDTSMEGNQVGLRNVWQRLRLLYGQEAELRVEGTNNGTIIAQIRLPSPSERTAEEKEETP
ncbi:MAG: histidine kinase [Oscillibacter sp.]|nr:histidine kinase [Oscillibacter sp.]